MQLLPWACACLLIYTVGFPCFVLWVVRSKKELIKEDQILRAMGLGDEKYENPNAYHIRKRYHKVYYHFKPGKIYWILLIIFRKFWIALSGLMFRTNPAFQLAIVLLVLFTSYVLQVCCHDVMR